ncbi:MAG: hypothetical protein ACTSVZ_04645 [Promethearchaeota archaeon]
MHLMVYVIQNLRLNRNRTRLRVAAIAFAVISTLVMGFLMNIYLVAQQGFFTPFSEFDQVVESGSNFTQFMPVSSSFNQSLQSNAENILNCSVYPALIISNIDPIVSFHFAYLFGMSLDIISEFWKDSSLGQGRWPENSQEVVVGWTMREKLSIGIRNSSFTVVGVFDYAYSFVDSIVLADLEILQNITDREGLISVMYIPNNPELVPTEQSLILREENIQFMESNYPQLDYLYSDDILGIQTDFHEFLDNITSVFILLTSVTALIFILAVNLLQVHHIKKEFNQFSRIGMNPMQYYCLYWSENGFILGLGVAVGVPSATLIFTILYSYIRIQSAVLDTVWHNIYIAFWILRRAFPIDYLITNLCWLGCFYAIILLVTTLYIHHYRKNP